MTLAKRRTAALAAAVSAVLVVAPAEQTLAQSTGRRAVGIDVSDWQEQNAQGHINWATVAAPVAQGGAGMQFAFIRSSRGGTTGTYDEHTTQGTLSHRYDDYEWVYNITNATANGILAGPYHFARPDILTNTGADEADHMIQQAGAWMRPGYLLPVFDFEAGAGQRDVASLSQFAVDFANRIKQVKGVAPIVYINQSYAQGNEINSTVPAAMPINWVARWPNQIYYDAIDHQHGDPVPVPVTANVYGLYNPSYPQVAQPEPWKFWQYNSRGRVPGIGNGVVAVDLDVAHGDIEFVKDHLVPALWMSDASGDWSTLSQWNSDNPGYVAGNDATGPAPRLPNGIDTVILDRPTANPVITLGGGNHSIRKLTTLETLNVTGGSLNVGYVPYAPAGGNFGSGDYSAFFAGNVTLSGTGSISAHAIQVSPGQTLALNGGTIAFDKIDLVRSPTTPAKISIGGNVTINPLNGGTAKINSPTSIVAAGSIDLIGAPIVTVADGAAETDLLVSVAVNGGALLTKAGPGTMRLAGGVTAPLAVTGGTLVVNGPVSNVTNNARFVFDLASGGSYAGQIGGNGTLVKRGAGNLDFTGPQPFTGAVAVENSTLRLTSGGRLASASGYTLNNATLALDNAAGNHNDRLSGGGLALNGGTVNFVANTTSEVAGDVLAVSGANTVALSGTGASSITFGSLTRAPGATITFGAPSGFGSVKAMLTSGFLPDAFVDQGTFANAEYAVVNADGSIREMTPGPGPNDSVGTMTPGRHVRPASNASVNAPVSIKTLNLGGATTSVGLGFDATLTLANGGILKSGGGQSLINGPSGSIAAPDGVEYVVNVRGVSDTLVIGLPVTGGAGLTKTGAGTLSLTAANTYAGTTSVNAGVLVAAPASISEDALVISGGATFRTAASFDTGRDVVLNHGSATIDTNGFDSTFRGVVSGTGGLTKAGAGALVLNGAGNTYAGPTTIAAGTLAAGAVNLGNGGDANTLTIAGGATLRTLGPIHTARTIQFTPGGASTIDTNGYDSVLTSDIVTSGSLVKQGAGTLTLAGTGNNYGGTTTIVGGTLVAAVLGTGANGLHFQNGGRWRAAGDVTFVRNIGFGTGGGVIDTDGYAVTLTGFLGNPGAFTKSGHGQLTLTSNNGHSGPLAVNNGALRLAGAGGALASSSGYTISGNGLLKLDNASAAGGNNNNRLSNTAPVTLNSGTVWLYGGPTTEVAGDLTLAGGYNHVIVNGSTTSTLAFGAFARQAGATLNFLNPSSTLKTTFASGVTAGSFIDQGVFVGSNYAVYDAAGHVRAMTAGAGDSDYATSVTANRHVRLTAATTSIPTTSIYTLSMSHGSTGTTHTLAAGAALTLSRGGLLSSGVGGVTISGGAGITAPAGFEMVFHTPETGDLLTISTPITGGAGLTKSGLGRVSLNSVANAYGGPTTIAGGTLRLSTSGVIPDASNLTIAHDAQFDLATRSETVGGTLTLAGAARVMSKDGNLLASGGTLTLAGANTTINYVAGGEGAIIENATFVTGTVTGTATFNIADGDAAPDLTIRANLGDTPAGNVRGMTKTGAGTLRLAGAANSLTGNVTITAGTLDVTGAITSGSGSVSIPAGGTLAGTGTIAKPTSLSGGVIDLSPGGTINTTLSVSNGTWRGQGEVNGAVTVPSGTLTIGAAANLTANAGVNVTGGTIAAVHANSTITGNVNYTSAAPGTWAGNIAGATSTLTLNNAATSLTLTSGNNHGGGTTVADGQLIVAADGALGTGTVTTTMVVPSPGTGHGGAVRLSDYVTINNALSIGGGGLTGTSQTAPGSTAALDNLRGVNTWAGNITLNGTGNNIVDPLLNQIGATAGTLVVSGVIGGGAGHSWAKSGHGDVVLTGDAPNTYTNLTRVFGGRLIVEKDGALGAAGSPTAASGNTFQLSGSASTLAFRAPPGSSGLTYTTFEVINTDGFGASDSPGGAAAPAQSFGTYGQVDNLGGDNTFAGQIALAGPLNASNRQQASIGVTAGSLHVLGGLFARAAATTPRDINKLGPGRLILSGDGGAGTGNPGVVPLVNSTFNVSAGTVELRSPSAQQSNLPGVTTWNVSGGAAVHLAAGQLATSTLNVAAGANVTVAPGGGKFLRTEQLDITSGGQIDLADNDMIVNYPTGGASPIGTFDGTAYGGITGHLAAAHNFGAWDAPGGITSSVAAADALVGGVTTLAVADATHAIGIGPDETWTWNGQTIDGSSVLVMFTYVGDLNLDGLVDGADYGVIDNAVQFPGTDGYQNGDFNYDGVIDGADYGLIDNAIQLQGPPLGGASAALSSAVAAVPEPSACLVATIGATLALRRRRRRP